MEPDQSQVNDTDEQAQESVSPNEAPEHDDSVNEAPMEESNNEPEPSDNSEMSSEPNQEADSHESVDSPNEAPEHDDSVNEAPMEESNNEPEPSDTNDVKPEPEIVQSADEASDNSSSDSTEQQAAAVVSPSETPETTALDNSGSDNPQLVTSSLPPASVSKPKRGFLKPVAIIAVIIVVLAGASAAAFYGIIQPNEPSNILKTAVLNTVKQNQVGFNGNVNLIPAGGQGVAAKINLTGTSNLNNKAFDYTLNFTVSGIPFSVEARYVDQNLYVKLGDLSSLENLMESLDSGSSQTIQTVVKEFSNQWIEIDSTLLEEVGFNCAMNDISPLTSSDINQLTDAYNKNQFLTINSTSSSSVNGVSAEQFNVTVNDDKGASFLNSTLPNLSIYKSIQSCGKSVSDVSYSNIKGDNKSTPLTIWVDKSTKRIVQIKYVPSAQDVAQAHEDGSIVMGLNYNPVNISAPSNSISLIDAYSKLVQELGGGSNASLPNLSNLLNDLSGSVSQ